jgi:hypothetical protein
MFHKRYLILQPTSRWKEKGEKGIIRRGKRQKGRKEEKFAFSLSLPQQCCSFLFKPLASNLTHVP